MEHQKELIWDGGIHFQVYREHVPGRLMPFEYVWRLDGARILALDTSGKLLVTKERRHEQNDQFDWRLPGGRLNHIGEAPVLAAQRELQEETGYMARSWKPLWSTTPDSTVRYQRHFFLATQLTHGPSNPDLGEIVEVHWFDLKRASAMALEGAIKEEISALAVLRLQHALTNGLTI
jgi:ADP-ribose pyrophosphatase